MTAKNIPLSKLHHSPSNPRKVAAHDAAFEALVASIRAHGLLQNLVVVPAKDGIFHVVAGNRRLDALRVVHDKADPKISCNVLDDDGLAASAIENMVRENMHPLDEADAVSRLISDDASIQTIAQMFGHSVQWVRTRALLSNLIKPVKDALRAGHIDLQCAAAIAIHGTDIQKEVVALDRWPDISSHHVNQMFVTGVAARHALFDWQNEYPKELIVTDLFHDTVTLLDIDTFRKHQDDAVQALAVKYGAEGWDKVEFSKINAWQAHYRTEDPEGPLSDEDEKKVKSLEKKMEKLDEKMDTIDGYDEDYRKLSTQHDDLAEELAALNEQREWTLSQKNRLAVVIRWGEGTIQPSIYEGVIQADNRKAEQDEDGNTVEDKDQAAELFAKRAGAQIDQWNAALNHACRLEGLADPRNVVITLLRELAINQGGTALREFNIHTYFNHGLEDNERGYINENKRTAISENPNVSFMAGLIDNGSVFTDLTDKQLIELLGTAFVNSFMIAGLSSRVFQPKMRDYWTPDLAFFTSYRKDELVEIIIDVTGEGEYDRTDLLARKKLELAALATGIFAGTVEPKSDAHASWMPPNFKEWTDSDDEADFEAEYPEAAE